MPICPEERSLLSRGPTSTPAWVAPGSDTTPRQDLPRTKILLEVVRMNTHLNESSPGHQLSNVGADQATPVPALKIEFLEAQPQHQLIKDPCTGH